MIGAPFRWALALLIWMAAAGNFALAFLAAVDAWHGDTSGLPYIVPLLGGGAVCAVFATLITTDGD